MAEIDLSILGDAMHGKSGNVVFLKTKTGTKVRKRSKPTDPKTPAQQAARERMTLVSKTYSGMTQDQLKAWRNYAKTLTHHNKYSGEPFTPSANNVFTGLATKFLQINPGTPLPLVVPDSTFVGDTVVVTAASSTGKITFTAKSRSRQTKRTANG